MKNNLLTKDAKTQKIFAKTALNELRMSDHSLGRSLALCLVFESAKNQLLAASIFNLAIALDAALHIPSESMLAAIRIQWWADALAKTTNRNVPLVACLQSHYQININFLPQLQEMIGEWQVACHDKPRESSAGWAAAWRLVALYLGHGTAAKQAAIIGRGLHSATRGQKYTDSICNTDVKSFRYNDQKEERSWLYLTACLHRKLQRCPDCDLESARILHHPRHDDPLLVWRILRWHFFGPPRRNNPCSK